MTRQLRCFFRSERSCFRSALLQSVEDSDSRSSLRQVGTGRVQQALPPELGDRIS